MVDQKAIESYKTSVVESYTVVKRGGIHRFRSVAEASFWYGCDVAEVEGTREGVNSILVWREEDGITYGSGGGLFPAVGVSYERAKVRSWEEASRNHCKYKWEDKWESIFFERPKSWKVVTDWGWRFATLGEANMIGERVVPSLEEPSHVLIWGLDKNGKETPSLAQTAVISGKGDLPKLDNSWGVCSLGWLLNRHGFMVPGDVRGNVEAIKPRSYKADVSYNPHTRKEVFLARGEADWVGHLRSQLTAESAGMLERAGFVVRVVSTNPFHMVGGVSLSEGDPQVYSGGFAIVEKDGCFVISSTSSWGRTLNETSHATPQGAAKALIQAFLEARDKVASVNNEATSTEVSVISPCVSYGKVAGPEVPGAAVPRFRTLGEAEIWYGEGGAGLVEGEVDSILVWRGEDGVTYGSGEGLLPPWGADMECVPLGVSGLHPHHYRYDWGGGEESIFFERPKSWYMEVDGPKFATREEVDHYYKGVLAYLNQKAKPSSDEPTHALIWELKDGVESRVTLYTWTDGSITSSSVVDTLVISGKGSLPSSLSSMVELKNLPALRLGVNVKLKGNVEALLARSYRVGDVRFQRRNEAELYLSRNRSLGKEVTPCGLGWNSYLSWTEGGEVKDSTRGMLPPGDFHLNEMGDPHHRHKEKPILLRGGRAKKEEELRESLAEELSERSSRTLEDTSATPKEVEWGWLVWGLLGLGGALLKGQSKVRVSESTPKGEDLTEEIECSTVGVASRK